MVQKELAEKELILFEPKINMEKLNLNDVVEYIENNISTFHQKRIASSNLHIVPINGCCYGKNSKPDKGDYFKYCGQEFWEFISNESNLYLEIIEPLGNKAKESKMKNFKRFMVK